jgi:hypothetical protein
MYEVWIVEHDDGCIQKQALLLSISDREAANRYARRYRDHGIQAEVLAPGFNGKPRFWMSYCDTGEPPAHRTVTSGSEGR